MPVSCALCCCRWSACKAMASYQSIEVKARSHSSVAQVLEEAVQLLWLLASGKEGRQGGRKEGRKGEGCCGLWLLSLLASIALVSGDLSLWLVASVAFSFCGFWLLLLWVLCFFRF